MNSRGSLLLGWTLAAASLLPGCGGQRADSGYDTRVEHPTYAASGPQVLFDEAHANSHRTGGTYRPFAELLRHDGYPMTVNHQPFTHASLAPFAVLVVANARGADGIKYAPAFTTPEVAAVRAWVEQGGALLLIVDHEPLAVAASALAAAFGVALSDGGGVEDAEHADPAALDPSQLLFTRENGLLSDHPITRGHNASEAIRRVISFTGSALSCSVGATPVLRLSPAATERLIVAGSRQITRTWYGDTNYRRALDDARPVTGTAQLVSLEVGAGRVVVSGEAAMLTAQVSGDRKFGMNVPGADNRQFVLNILHWLSRELN